MAFKKPTKKHIAALVGGVPLSTAFNPETGDLCVIAPNGQKFRFTPQEWETHQSSGEEVPGSSQEPPQKAKKAGRKPRNK